MGKKQSGDVDKLVEKGYSKTKAAKALKDAGNNLDVALQILLRQEEQRQNTNPNPSTNKTTGAPIPVPPRPIRGTTSPAVDEAMEKARARKHPCIVQYKKCQFGDGCWLKDYPGDTCINYFSGNCVYGSACRRRHYIDGVDIREGLRPEVNDFIVDGPGRTYRPTGQAGSKVQMAELVSAPESGGHDGPSFLPEAADFNYERGAEPTYTDPNVYSWSTPETDRQVPRPFLEKLIQQEKEGGGTPAVQRVTAPTQRKDAPRARRRHPCIAQCGGCKYGDDCQHAHRDADVCVFYLNGICKFSAADCHYRHETDEEYTARLLAETRETAYDETSELTSAGKSEWRQKAPTTSSAPSAEQEEELEAMNSANPASTEEMDVFLNLLEVFTKSDPAFVLQALRSAGGDAAVAAELLERAEKSEDVDAALALAMAEDEEEMRLEEKAAADTNALLTLCSLFPSTELSSIEAALSNSKGDLAEAYGVLFCSEERMTQERYGRCRGEDLSPADTLRLDRLCGMFPDIDRAIVKGAFCAAERNTTTTISVLNELTSELLSADERDELGRRATRIEPSASFARLKPPKTPGERSSVAAAAASDKTTFQFATEEEVRQQYKDLSDTAQEYEDWRRVRERAYLVNSCRIRVLSLASAAFLRGDGRTAKQLSREGKQLGAEYCRLNRLAMLSLELERLSNSPASTLDLHGFHVPEALEVVSRRVALCIKKHIGQLTIVTGSGNHSKKGHASLYPEVMHQLKTDPFLVSHVRVFSVKPAFVKVNILF